MLPPEPRGNFQDLTSRPQGVVEVLDHALGKHDGVVIAPMTVTTSSTSSHFEETVGRLRELGHGVRHFALLADRETVLKRLREPECAEHLWTHHTTVAKTAHRIAVPAGPTLTSNRDGAVRGRLRRARTGVKHIRLD